MKENYLDVHKKLLLMIELLKTDFETLRTKVIMLDQEQIIKMSQMCSHCSMNLELTAERSSLKKKIAELEAIRQIYGLLTNHLKLNHDSRNYELLKNDIFSLGYDIFHKNEIVDTEFLGEWLNKLP